MVGLGFFQSLEPLSILFQVNINTNPTVVYSRRMCRPLYASGKTGPRLAKPIFEQTMLEEVSRLCIRAIEEATRQATHRRPIGDYRAVRLRREVRIPYRSVV